MLGARRCMKPDGTMEFFNEQLFDMFGVNVQFKSVTQSEAETAMEATTKRFRRLNNLRRALPIAIAIVALCCCGCCGLYCKRTRNKHSQPAAFSKN